MSGEIVQIGDATLYHGDCREILPGLAVHDLLLTDPPHGLGEAAGKNKSRGQLAQATDYGDDAWDNEPIPDWVLSLMLTKAKHQIIFGGNYYKLPPTSCVLVWDKDNSGDFADAELTWTNLQKAVRLKKFRWNGMLQENMAKKETRYHPTQKPVAVMEWAISHAPESVTMVCDPFMGSGTTGVACVQLGKTFTGIERERKYFDIACERIARAYAQPRLFEEPPAPKPKQLGMLDDYDLTDRRIEASA
jgi:DNA modification methylase